MRSITTPIGGEPGNSPRKPIKEEVNAADQVSAESVGGRLPAATKKDIATTDARAVTIKSMMIKVSNLVLFVLLTKNVDEALPSEYCFTA